MKTTTLTIRLDKDLNALLTKASRRSGGNRSEVAREALRRKLRISQFETLRGKIMPFAEARGYLTDEDVFADVREGLSGHKRLGKRSGNAGSLRRRFVRGSHVT
jgi:hypothetical protein